MALWNEPGGFLAGSLVPPAMRSGRPGGRCHDDPTHLHGPYAQWSDSHQGQRFNRWPSPDQVARSRLQVTRGRHPKALLADLDAAEIRRAERAEGWGT